MSLSVIGAGFGRTGTLALKCALEKLGYGKCYHMLEIQAHPEYTPLWSAVIAGESYDWDRIFSGYGAAVDWPVCSFWRELVEFYPQAKVVLTTRDPDRWYESVLGTIHRSLQDLESADKVTRQRRLMARKIVMEQTFDNRFEDRAHAIAVFRQHIREVQETVAADRLLTYEVSEGWGPLCEFLACPEPSEPFPRTNTKEEFRSIFPGRS